MQKIILTTYFTLFSLSFSACSNVEMGFDEDSVFYSKKPKTIESSELKVQENQVKEEENRTTFYYEKDDGE